ncbi:unnamed protein product [Anisakis simplex]|uniref:SAP domain-containing protein n=1 Tax=Anisakis simplex TaxID=6269 RepID=A0A0M3JTM8_ANISI|nr:unnamed protein product [Anisakis simplex]
MEGASVSCADVASSLAPSKNGENDLLTTLQSLSKEELIQKIINTSRSRQELNKSSDINELKEQLKVAKRRENLAVLRLAVKEKQFEEVMAERDWTHDKNAADVNKLDNAMMDHSIGVVFAAMRSELRASRKEAKSAKLELKSIKAPAGNAESKKLAAKCRSLEEQLLEAKTLTHRLARLETLLAYSQKTVDGLRRKQRDLDDVIAEHDEEMSRVQAELVTLREENARLRESTGITTAASTDLKTSLSRPDSRTQPSNCTPDENNQDDGESDKAEDKAADEMVMVSSPEMDAETSDGQTSAKRAKLDSSNTECQEEVILVSSPEHECEPDEVSVISSSHDDNIANDNDHDGNDNEDDTNIHHANISDESD